MTSVYDCQFLQQEKVVLEQAVATNSGLKPGILNLELKEYMNA